ncbi:MAG: GNAT family N-acetyltransferase, partial [Caulobacteraceae bacterium]
MDERAIEPPSLIPGPGFVLRPFSRDDAASLSQAIEESRSRLQRWQGIGEQDGTPDLCRQRTASWSAAFNRRDRLQYALVDANGGVLGGCALEQIDWTALTFKLGYWLRTSAVGNGYATGAVRALTRLAFTGFHARRVAIWTDSENAKSIAVAERAGFAREDVLRNERLNALGESQDTIVFSRMNGTD